MQGGLQCSRAHNGGVASWPTRLDNGEEEREEAGTYA